mmetsp:Transcript_7336/g.27448  ORF Transcript_7336/g.27448 Transcript_7336/m.27448 type:complete len:859 (-) Transcript_7336:100-2676(-)|eukprot:CAMPEP_0117439802 /NCGR_PEP_ID=MMETSP0759-20121206/2750_1 /TAXON_ID=63605 /ORGANISM="Percolomonas cosmopolitus, Strain WS" /LENGTH=858 /DNA_ID=CAMNT_0005231523 /DNA_START=183 /DNA_END=2759 /DNA_ORIENTATION=+
MPHVNIHQDQSFLSSLHTPRNPYLSSTQSLPSSPIPALSSPLEESLTRSKPHFTSPPQGHPYQALSVTFLVTLPVPTTYDVAITGDIPQFGSWDISSPLYLRKKNPLEYTVKVKINLQDLANGAVDEPESPQTQDTASRDSSSSKLTSTHVQPDLELSDKLRQNNYIIRYKYITLLDGCPMSWETANRKLDLKWWIDEDEEVAMVQQMQQMQQRLHRGATPSSVSTPSSVTSPNGSVNGQMTGGMRLQPQQDSAGAGGMKHKVNNGDANHSSTSTARTSESLPSQSPLASPSDVARALLFSPKGKYSVDHSDPTLLLRHQHDGLFGSSSLRKFGRNVPSLYKPVDSEWIYNNLQLRIYQPTDAHPRINDEDVVIKPSDKKARVAVVDTDTYVISAPSPQTLCFHVDKYDPDDPETVQARAFVTYDQLLSKDVGEITSPFVDKKTLKVIGHFRALFLVVKPFFHRENTLRNVWRTLNWEQQSSMKAGKRLTKFIGHRGLGKSRSSKNRALIAENSMLSFQRSAAVGVDYVEFDVQLTKDLQTVIFHDFHAKIRIDQNNTLCVPVQDLTLKQLTKLGMRLKPSFDDENVRRLNKLMEQRTHKLKKSNSYDLLPTIGDEHSKKDVKRAIWSISEAFTTLKDCFDKVPIHVGFNIEIKWPIDRNELANPNIDRNVYIDYILKCVFEHAGPRHIMFSSFDPDICTLLNLKQPRYPVFFLTEAGTATFPDHRCNSIPAAISFAKAIGLRGIVTDCRPIIKNPSWIPIIHEHDLMIATFGEQNTLAENIKVQQDMGIDAIICDNVDKILKTRAKQDVNPQGLLTGGVTRLSDWMVDATQDTHESSSPDSIVPERVPGVTSEDIDG